MLQHRVFSSDKASPNFFTRPAQCAPAVRQLPGGRVLDAELLPLAPGLGEPGPRRELVERDAARHVHLPSVEVARHSITLVGD